MSRNSRWYLVRVAVVTAIFGMGYFTGSVTQRSADAQLGDIGSDVMKRASEGGGSLGTVARLGTTITDLEKNLSAMQKNVDTLKSVKAALGGGIKK